MTDAQMKVFADFILQAVYPPNPSRQLNNALRQSSDLKKNEELGRQAFFRVPGPDACDNCVNVANGPSRSDGGAPQRDSNGDGYGNVCDADLNNDGFVNSLDLGLFKTVFGPAALGHDDLRAAADFNSDGQVNSLDLGLFKKMFSQPAGPSALSH